MATPVISVPEIRVNDELISIIPNSVAYTGGEGEITVRSTSAGSGTVDTIHAENAETKISMIKFKVPNNVDIDGLIRDWKTAVGTNVVKMTQANVGGTTFIRVFAGMSLMNDVERNPTADGDIELEFSGDPMIIS